MKQIYSNKELFNGLPGLSCIENYFLYILAEKKLEYRHLFYKSFIPLSTIEYSFAKEKIPYAYFNKTPRLQEIAAQNGMAQVSYHEKDLEADFLREHDYCCVKVKPEYVAEKYRNALWRDDHFILLTDFCDGTVSYLNDNPRDKGSLSPSEMEEASANGILCFDAVREINDSAKKEFFRDFYDTMEKEIPVNSHCHIDDLMTARDILGILRISRKRMQEYCSLYTDSSFLSEYLYELDRQYSILEYMRIRGYIDYNKIRHIFETLRVSDAEAIDHIRIKMRAIS